MTASSREQILETLSASLVYASNGRAKVDSLAEDARLIEDIGLSSLDLLDLRCELEKQWQLELGDDELAVIQTIGDLLLMIDTHTRGRHHS